MKKYFLLFICFASIACFAQDYKTQIDQFRKGYMDDFLQEPRSPVKKDDLQFLRFYDADITFRVTATVTMLTNTDIFAIPTFNGSSAQYLQYALIKFTLKGKPLQLTVYRNVALSKTLQYKDYLFLPFTDATNGQTTYGGGRYIDLREGDFTNGTLILDFNKAYNPYCAFGAGFSCPKPPDENQLAIAIEAGEKLYAGVKKH